MWKSTTRSFKSIFCKYQCSHKNVTTREARNDNSVNCLRKLSPAFFGSFHRSYGCEGQKRGPFARDDKKEEQKTEKRNFLNNFQHDLLGALRLSGIFVLGWYILQPLSHQKIIFRKKESDKCAFLILSRYTWNEYSKLINYFSCAQPICHVLPTVQAAAPKKKDGIYEDEVDGLDFDNIEKAHRSVLGSLSNLHGANCMTKGLYTEAVSHFEEAAQAQHPAAMYNLGVCYEMGLGTDQNMKKAAEMYKKASDLGHATAMYNLGVFYIHGLGDLKTDLNQARKLFKIAASQGQPNAQKALEMEGSVEAEEKLKIKDMNEVSYTKNSTDSRDVKLSSRKSDKLGNFKLLNLSSLIGAVINDKTQLDSPSLDDSGALDLSPQAN